MTKSNKEIALKMYDELSNECRMSADLSDERIGLEAINVISEKLSFHFCRLLQKYRFTSTKNVVKIFSKPTSLVD